MMACFKTLPLAPHVAKFQLHTGPLFKPCHCLKDSAPLQFTSATGTLHLHVYTLSELSL